MPPPETLNWCEAGHERAADVAAAAAAAFDPHYRESWSEAQILGLLTGADGWLVVGEDGAGIATFALCRHAAAEAELLLCATRPDRRRTGLARMLLAAVAESAVRRSARRLFLEVRATNGPALALYESAGFRRVGRRPGYYRTMTGDSIDAVTLALDLACASPARTSPEVLASLALFPHR